MKFRHNIKKAIAVVVFCLFTVSGYAGAADWDKVVAFEPIDVEGIKPAQILEDEIRSGLDVIYYLKFFERHLKHLPKVEHSEYRSFRGKPILQLNHQFEDNKVFDSGTNRGVGMRLSGYLHFSRKGIYDLQALSNDGVIMYVSSKLAIEDPEQHSDRLSNIAHVTIDTPGRYPVVIEYFQRKGTAALKLLWQVPGSKEFVVVPKSAYSHRSDYVK